MGTATVTGQHPRRSRLTRGLAAAALGVGLLAPAMAVAPSGAAHAAADDDVTLTVGVLNEVDSFNPFLGIEITSFEMWALMYDYLISYSMEDMSVEPGLATSWETSEDGLTWTFDITDEASWSDGEPLTAEDVAYTYNRVLDGGPEASTWGSYLANVSSITAPDDATLVLELEKPSSSLPLLPIPIIPEHVWKDVEGKQDVKAYKNEPEGGQPVVGSGPFRLVEGSAGGSTVKFEANPDYWKGASHLDGVVFRVYKSEDPLVQALKKGEVDFADGISALQVRALEGVDGITAQDGDSPGFDEIAFNVGSVDLDSGEPIGDGNPALLDPAFRHALGYAIDNDQLIEKVYQGAGLPGSTIVPPAYEYHWAPEGDDAFSYDPERAGQLLDEAGYTEGDDGLRTMPDGSPIGTLRLFARSESPTSLDTMNFFKEWLGDIGIDAEVTSMESSKLTNVILDGDFDAFQWGWYVEPDPTSMLSYMTCDQRGNWSDSWYCSDEYDALYEQQLTETDHDARVELVKQMQQIVFEDSPYLVTAYNTVGEAFRSDRFACLVQQPNPGGVWLFQYGVYNYLNMRPAADAGDCGGVTDATEATSSAADDGVGTGTMVGIGVAGLAVVGLGAVFALRRRGTAGDRE
ncbi:ABC transporter substrate-binding protein [Nocardioides sp. GY 10113]|uniref:ABC transporter substrate-binding protein n=1 Tax=Nocardioides sp. GY 10113 TaxID=2569761 RepID=UPI0014588670|nr:ABC transporter substrate-binding protein [Nocardioides sp. GY 10113]